MPTVGTPVSRADACGSCPHGTKHASDTARTMLRRTPTARVLLAVALAAALAMVSGAPRVRGDGMLHSVANGGEPVCIASVALLGPSKASGLATAMTNLALELATAGVPVTVLYAGAPLATDRAAEHWRSVFSASGVRLVEVPAVEEVGRVEGAQDGAAVAYRGTLGQKRAYAYVACACAQLHRCVARGNGAHRG